MPRTLANPPIQEAILEVLFQFPNHMNADFLKTYAGKNQYVAEQSETIWVVSGKFDVNSTQEQMKKDTIGFQYRSKENNIAIQTRTNGFSVSFLNQRYKSWEAFIPIALDSLMNFISFSQPLKATRFSLRFINKIEVPLGTNIAEYIIITPNLEVLNYPTKTFLLRSEFVDEKMGGTGVVIEMLQPVTEKIVNVYLDIDVIKTNEIPQTSLEKDIILEQFEKLRKFKNDIFFSCLTETALKVYE